ncbi:hypothetical protein SAMN05216196_11276 [Lutimaribacter pacificus]|uniref:Uncharacterized protein n=1 Tax=Lutimaribacter pacificus TaxID=391948 RepID=A0A1H0NAX6_9RHOB|nr:hypothetical protein [Lutimaribacter pacificus]SDO89801.1 hypothetical protein SAMN05216196_11276 [Lutimaribacter pacificus]SHK84753.1 hypothetical protein SAMN05444142_1111 [Lutimaribacter pacificus]
MTHQPIHKIRLGLITATIWDNDGFYSVDLSRSYRDKDGNWQNTATFSQADLLNIAKCAERAEIWISRKTHAAQ